MSAVRILRREPAEYVSTFWNEIVVCRLPDGSERRLMSKRGGVHLDPTYGHRGGVPYEAEVYQRVLAPLGVSTPSFHDAHFDPVAGETTLLTEYLEDAVRLELADPDAVFAAAKWIGTFHRLNEPRVDALSSVIRRYEAKYYLGWTRRTLEFAGDSNPPWLRQLARRFERLSEELLSAAATVIHGEYYPKNILVRGSTICPIDWESAALAAGEIDLASLTEGWPDEDKVQCQAEYCRARWPEGAPALFNRRLVIAETYLMFRWLGDRPEWISGEDAEWQFDQLRRLGEELGVLE